MKRPTRVPYLSAALLVLTALLALQAGHAAVVADDGPSVSYTPTATADGDAALPNDIPRGSTLLSVQSYGGFVDNGRAVIVSPQGERVWEYDPPNARVFDAELLGNGNVLVAVGERVPAEDCPDEYSGGDDCIRNRVVEVTYEDASVAWEYEWYDAFVDWHEVHDVDRLANGETAIVDMGNDRAFTVDQDGEITWEWDAVEHLGEGSAFREEYGGPERQGPESDWTHMNDIDYVADGYFQLSIRNFDVTIWVDPETDDIVRVFGEPGNHDVMKEQHNPQWLPERGTLLVADSENDRVVEVRDGEVVWAFGGPGLLSWPRDADRLPNGNTLITDTYNNRVIEVTPQGDVVWEYEESVVEDGERKGGLVYQADRLSVDGQPVDEEQSTFGTPTNETATPFPDGRTSDGGSLESLLVRVEAWASFYFPNWVGLPALANIALAVVVSLWLAGELAWLGWRTRGT